LVLSILEVKTMPCYLSTWTNSTTEVMCHGSSSFGMLTTLIGKSLIQRKKKCSFWWRDVLKLVDLYKGVPLAKCGVALQFCLGWMSRMIIYSKTSFQDCSHLSRTRLYQWLNSSSIIALNSNFIYHYRFRHSKNIRICNKSSSKSRL
jgi:hypothetical protein